MKTHSYSPMGMINSLWRNVALVSALVKRDVIGRYKGSVIGIVWSFLHPVFMLAVYTFVFSIVFNARWGSGSDSKLEFALVLFSGLVVFNLFSECVSRAPSLVLSNVSYVKRIVFPLEILPWVVMGSALFHALISLLVWFIFYSVFFGVPQITVFLFPVVILPLLLLTMGFSWFLSSLGVYLRDVAQFVSIIIPALLFLSPIFYPVSALPESYQLILHINPLTPAIEQVRSVLIWGNQPAWDVYIIYLSVASIIAWGGFAWFQHTRRGFADVL